MRIHDVPATTGYGEPAQKFFKMEDGERIVAMLSFDPRVLNVPDPAESGEPQPPYAVAVTKQGLSFRFSLSAHKEASTRAGRRYGRLNEGDEIVMVGITGEKDGVLAVTSDGHALGVPVSELALLSGVGKGSMLMKVDEDARVLGAIIAISPNDSIVVETGGGKEMTLTYKSVLGKRAQAGSAIVRRNGFARVVLQTPSVTPLEVS
jgi:DNA gyrase subunit A